MSSRRPLIASLLAPQAYCKYGCPTGKLLELVRSHGRADRFNRRDAAAVPLLTFRRVAGKRFVRIAFSLAEVDETLTMDIEDVRIKITPHTRAIIPVHMTGIPCNLEPILDLARDRERRTALGRAAREKLVREFSWESIVERLTALANEVRAGR